MQIVKFLKFKVGIISLDSQDPRILEMCEKCRRRCHWTIYQELCQLIIRAVQSLLCWIMWRSLIQRLSLHVGLWNTTGITWLTCDHRAKEYNVYSKFWVLTKIDSYLWQKKHPGQNLLLLTLRREGGKLHPHSCIPEARCDNGQIEKLNYLEFSSPAFKVGAHQNQQSTYNETLCLNALEWKCYVSPVSYR